MAVVRSALVGVVAIVVGVLAAPTLVEAVGLDDAVGHEAAHAAGTPVTAGTPDASPDPAPEPAQEATPEPTPEPSQQPSAEATEEPTEKPVPEPGPPLHEAGDAGDEVRDLQARLVQIDWLTTVTGTYDDATTEAVEGFQAKRGLPMTGAVDAATLERLHGMTGPPSYEQLHNIVEEIGALDPRCREGRVLCIDKSTQSLRWVVDGTVLRTLDVRFGASGTPTREGAFTVERKSRDHVSTLYGSSMPYAMFFSRGQAVHYSSDFAARGYSGASHGCVNVRDREGLAALYDEVRVGDAVIVYWS